MSLGCTALNCIGLLLCILPGGEGLLPWAVVSMFDQCESSCATFAPCMLRKNV